MTFTPEQMERRRIQARQRERRKKAGGFSHRTFHRATGGEPREWRERAAEIPDDTRSLSARLLGDPLPGRSALDGGVPDG